MQHQPPPRRAPVSMYESKLYSAFLEPAALAFSSSASLTFWRSSFRNSGSARRRALSASLAWRVRVDVRGGGEGGEGEWRVGGERGEAVAAAALGRQAGGACPGRGGALLSAAVRAPQGCARVAVVRQRAQRCPSAADLLLAARALLLAAGALLRVLLRRALAHTHCAQQRTQRAPPATLTPSSADTQRTSTMVATTLHKGRGSQRPVSCARGEMGGEEEGVLQALAAAARHARPLLRLACASTPTTPALRVAALGATNPLGGRAAHLQGGSLLLSTKG